MRLVAVDGKAVGEVIGKTLYADDGRVLLKKGTKLTASYIRNLEARGYRFIYVKDPLAPEAGRDEILSEETKIRATRVVRKTMTAPPEDEDRGEQMRQVSQVVNKIIDEIKMMENLTIGLSSIKTVDGYTFEHSVDVCTLAIILGDQLYLYQNDLKTLALGAVLHDIGKIQIPEEVLKKPASLTPEEMEQVKEHPMNGYHILKDQLKTDLRVAHCALQHHERLDGSGYPRQLKGEQIHRYAKICMVCDVYDAMTSDRPYRERRWPSEVLEEMHGMAREGRLDTEMVRKFAAVVTAYPEGSIVMLEDQRIGVVLNDAGEGERLLVKIVTDRDRRLFDPPEMETIESDPAMIRHMLWDYPASVRQQIGQSDFRAEALEGGR